MTRLGAFRESKAMSTMDAFVRMSEALRHMTEAGTALTAGIQSLHECDLMIISLKRDLGRAEEALAESEEELGSLKESIAEHLGAYADQEGNEFSPAEVVDAAGFELRRLRRQRRAPAAGERDADRSLRGPGEERCDDFSSRDLYPNVLAACDGDGHYRCSECCHYAGRGEWAR